MPEMITKSFSSLFIKQASVPAIYKSIKAGANHQVQQLPANKTDEFVQSISCQSLPLSSKLPVSEFCWKELCPSL